MEWYYTPVSVRVKAPDQTHSTYSGICALFSAGDDVLASSVAFVYHGSGILDLKIYVSTPQEDLTDLLIWNEAIVSEITTVFQDWNQNKLYDCLNHSVENGFSFFPLDSCKDRSLKKAIHIVHLAYKPSFTIHTKRWYSVLTKSEPYVSSKITVRSCPFSDTNPAMFADFRSTGSIAQVLNGTNEIHGYLSDIKYLDNMAGAPVTLDDGSIVGLVLGNLRKRNGDGDLTVIIPWELVERSMNLRNKIQRSYSSHSHLQSILSSVMLVYILREDERISCGSCVLLKSDTIVTNLHVVAPCLESKSVRCQILVNSKCVIDITDVDDIKVPFQELDLAFIKLSPQNQAKIGVRSPVKVGTMRASKPEEVVHSVGYGLIARMTSEKPLVSRGQISKIKSIEALNGLPKIPTMTIVSSLCWNGSSGGGLFGSQGELMGLICSNAQVYLPGQSGISEKVPLFCLCIPIDLVIACFDVAYGKKLYTILERTKSLWKLNYETKEIYNRDLKL